MFGIANLAAFISAPIFGVYGTKIGAKLLYNFGAFLQPLCGLAFAFLDYVENTAAFLGLSYLLRYIIFSELMHFTINSIWEEMNMFYEQSVLKIFRWCGRCSGMELCSVNFDGVVSHQGFYSYVMDGNVVRIWLHDR